MYMALKDPQRRPPPYPPPSLFLHCGVVPILQGEKNNYVHTFVCSIYMYVCIVIFYSWMFTIYPTYEWLYTYIHTCIYTYLVNYTYVCMYVRCECWLIVQCMHMYHIYVYTIPYIYMCVCVGYIPSKKMYMYECT